MVVARRDEAEPEAVVLLLGAPESHHVLNGALRPVVEGGLEAVAALTGVLPVDQLRARHRRKAAVEGGVDEVLAGLRCSFDALAGEIKKNLGSRGAGAFTVPGLLKITKKKVPARAAKKNVPNPFKPGEFMDVAARPAYNKVALRALKNLKDMV